MVRRGLIAFLGYKKVFFSGKCLILRRMSKNLIFRPHAANEIRCLIFLTLNQLVMALQIGTFSISRLTIGSTENFHLRCYEMIMATTPAVLHIETQATAYKAAIDQLTAILKRKTAYIATVSLSEADYTRDCGISTVINVIDAFKDSIVEVKRLASRRLLPQIAPYRRTRYREYTTQTAETDGLLRVLEAEENAEAVETLGITDDVAALREANAAFDEAHKAKAEEESERLAEKSLDSAAVVAEVNRQYEQIVQIINAYAIVQPTDELNSFIKKLNGQVEVFASIVGSGSSATKPSTDPGTDTGEGTDTGGDDSGSGDEGGSPSGI